jgi:O-antigen/teichoic acid export membrane protein
MRFVRRLFNTGIFWSYSTTCLRFGGLLLILPVVLRKIPSEQLGLFYLFQSLYTIAFFLDIGFSATITRTVSYLWVGAPSIQAPGGAKVQTASSAIPNWPLIQELIGTFQPFFHMSAVALFLILSAICIPYYEKAAHALESPHEAVLIWLAMSFGTSLNFAGSIWPALLGGINHVRDQQFGQFLAIAAGYMVTLVGLLLGFQLWALVVSQIAQGLLNREYARLRFQQVVGTEIRFDRLMFDWTVMKKIWPSAWRTGLIGGAVTFILNLPVLMTSSLIGLDKAASVGLTMQIALMVSQLASVGMLVKMPMFSMLRVQRQRQEIRRIFFQRLALYGVLLGVGTGCVFLLGDWILVHVVHSKTPLPSQLLMLLIFIFVGVEGFQALFRLLAMSSNELSFWKPLVFSCALLPLLGWSTIGRGMILFLGVLIVVKFIVMDQTLIRVGIHTLKITADPSRCE